MLQISKTAATFFVLVTIIIVAGTVTISNQVITAELGSHNAARTIVTVTKAVANSSTGYSGEINQVPTVVPIKVEWCNTSNSGQDRFCASNIQVVQGDIVQIMFIQNDTDTHTFTLTSGPYDFQINDTVAGLANFLQNKVPINGSCVNGNYLQDSQGVSGVYCVSGRSLLSNSYLSQHDAANFAAEQNSNPAQGFGNSSNEHPITIPVSDKMYYGGNSNLSGIEIPPNATSSEVWGIGAFQASYAGVFEFTCIYHLANGMFGYLTVLPNQYCATNPVACGMNATGVGAGPNNGGSGSQGAGKNSTGTVTVNIQNGSSTNTILLGFSPQTITLVIGKNNTVSWVNDDFTVHTVTANEGSFDSGLIQPGANFTTTFSTPGTYQYHCSIHPWMKGTINVLPGN
jgi:plastocyanin